MNTRMHVRASGALASALAAGVLALCVTSSLTTTATAEPADLSGSWSGSGSVAFATGSKERARCRASFSRAGGSSYLMSATCATASARVAQTAKLRKTGANSYSGQFRNPEYNVSGSIHITVSGRSQSVSLSSDSGSANFQLRKL